MVQRSEEQELAGLIPCAVGRGKDASVVLVSTLPIAKAREWRAKMTGAVGKVAITDFRDLAQMGGLAGVASEQMLDLVVEYDEAGALGGKDRLEQTCDDSQVYAIFRSMLDVSYPYVRDIQGVLAVILPLLTEPSTPRVSPSPGPSSTNGQSATGTSPARGSSKKRSTTRS